MVSGQLVDITAVSSQNVILSQVLRYLTFSHCYSFRVGCEVIHRKEDLKVRRHRQSLLLEVFCRLLGAMLSGDVAETPLADGGRRGLVRSTQVLPSAGRTGMQA